MWILKFIVDGELVNIKLPGIVIPRVLYVRM